MGVGRRIGAAVVAVMVATGVLAGCGLSEEEKVAVQEAQLKELVAQADGWGADIIAQIPEAEVELLSDNAGGVGKASDYGVEWPKYYYWDQIVVLHADGPRSPTEVADDLEPWLEQQGWERNADSEPAPRRDSFASSYFRDGYHLTVEVYTQDPPRTQSLHFSIVTPQTDPRPSLTVTPAWLTDSPTTLAEVG